MNPVTLSLSKGGFGYGSTGFEVGSAERLTMTGMNGMSTLAEKGEALAVDVSCSAHSLTVTLADGRTISAPLAWFAPPVEATPDQRAEWELIGGGIGIHWEAIDEDISIASLLQPENFMRLPSERMRPTREKRRPSVGRRNARG
jgi:hypothetical protein